MPDRETAPPVVSEEAQATPATTSTYPKSSRVGTFLIIFGITATIGVVLILWGDAKNNNNVVFAGLAVLSLSVLSWIPALCLLTYLMVRDILSLVRSRRRARHPNLTNDGQHNRDTNVNCE